MSFNESPMRAMVSNVTGAGQGSGDWRWKIEFKIQEGAPIALTRENGARGAREEEGFFAVTACTNIDIVRDYLYRRYDHFNAILQVPAGVWMKFLLPCREFLRVMVTRERLTRRGGDYDEHAPQDVWELKPLFRLDASNNSERTQADLMARDELDMKGFIDLDVDLVDPAVEQLRQMLIGNNWRQCTAEEVLKGVLTVHNTMVEIDGETVMQGLLFEKGANQDRREHILIPQGTPLMELPAILQDKLGGIYPVGLGAYVQERQWYVWPAYDTESYNAQTKTATLLIVPPTMVEGVEKTFLVEGDQVTIVASSSATPADLQQQRFLNEGDGARFTSASKMHGEWLTTKDNKAVASRTTNNSEVQLKDGRNKTHYAPFSQERITDNNYLQLSRLASRRGFQLNCNWQNADHSLITPGMCFKVIYMDKEEVKQVFGRVIKMHMAAQKVGTGATSRDMTTSVALTLFCNFSLEESNE